MMMVEVTRGMEKEEVEVNLGLKYGYLDGEHLGCLGRCPRWSCRCIANQMLLLSGRSSALKWKV